MIRHMEMPDVPQVVAIHRASFPNFFLSFLGPRFLDLYYRGVCRADDGIRFVYLDELGAIGGFVAGSADPRGFYTALLRRDWLRFGMASLGAVVRRPAIIPRLLRAVRQPGAAQDGAGAAGLFSLGVDPRLQGRGAGRQLVSAFLAEARHHGSGEVRLTTDREGNDGVNAFYRSLGFVLASHFVTPEGRAMNQYRITVPPENAV